MRVGEKGPFFLSPPPPGLIIFYISIPAYTNKKYTTRYRRRLSPKQVRKCEYATHHAF